MLRKMSTGTFELMKVLFQNSNTQVDKAGHISFIQVCKAKESLVRNMI
jgi:hypothetical protein